LLLPIDQGAITIFLGLRVDQLEDLLADLAVSSEELEDRYQRGAPVSTDNGDGHVVGGHQLI